MIRSRAAFTLIELLVVIAIIGVLMGILVPTLGMVMERGKESSCQNEIKQIETALASYESVYRDYPPSRLSEIGIRGDGINEGVEALLACLTTQDPNPFWEVHEDKIGNSDGDKAPKPLSVYTKSILSAPDLYEMNDPWGNPYVYIHGKDIQTGYHMNYQVDGSVVDVVPVAQGDKPGVVPGLGKYQIWSFGSNRVNDQGKEDDIVSWRSK